MSEGDCQTCHTLHRSEQLHLLIRPVFETCIECHDEPEDLSEDSHSGDNVEQCTRCHDPHFGVTPLLRPDAPRVEGPQADTAVEQDEDEE